MVEIAWPDFIPNDPRWKRDGFGEYSLIQRNPEGDSRIIWTVTENQIPTVRSRREIYPEGLHRTIEEFTYPILEDGTMLPNQLRVHLNRLHGNLSHSVTFNSANYVWRELEFTSNGLHTNVSTEYSPAGLLLRSELANAMSDGRRVFTTRFDFSDLPDGWIDYHSSYTDIGFNTKDLLEGLKPGEPVTLDRSAFTAETLAEGRKRLGEGVTVLGGIIYTVDSDSEAGEIIINILRRNEQNVDPTTLLINSRVTNASLLFAAACLAEVDQLEQIIKQVKLEVQSPDL